MIRMCPHHGLDKWLVLQTFYKGLTHQTKAYVDSAAGGGIMNKTLDEDFALIESMASHHFQWSSERAVAPQPVECMFCSKKILCQLKLSY